VVVELAPMDGLAYIIFERECAIIRQLLFKHTRKYTSRQFGLVSKTSSPSPLTIAATMGWDCYCALCRGPLGRPNERCNDEEFKWLDQCRCLSFNSHANKAYISGRGEYHDYGAFHVKEAGRDPNDTGENELDCFAVSNRASFASFPFHEACWEVLTRALGCANWREVDKDVMHGVMIVYAKDTYERRGLDLEYGLYSLHGQFWECEPGEEVGPTGDFESTWSTLIEA
jgi:hypothetical protein